MSNKVYEKQNSIINEDGEQVSYETIIIKKVTQESFMQVYLEDLSGMMKISTIGQFKVLIWLWKNSYFNSKGSDSGNEIILVKMKKEEMAKDTELSYSRVNNIITELTKLNLLINKGRCVYSLNPRYFFKGYLTDRTNTITATIKYEIE